MSSVAPSVQALEQARQQLETLERQLQDEIASLPQKYGFKSVDAFIEALRGVSQRNTKASPSTAGANAVTRNSRKRSTGRAASKSHASAGGTAPVAAPAGDSELDAESLEIVADLVKAKKSDAEIASILSVDEATIARERAKLSK